MKTYQKILFALALTGLMLVLAFFIRGFGNYCYHRGKLDGAKQTLEALK